MADEKEAKQEVQADPQVTPDQDRDNAATVAVNEQTAKALARIVKDEYLKLLGAETAEAVAKAKQDISREQAVSQSVSATTSAAAASPVELSYEQRAELMKTMLVRATRDPSWMPDPSLDVDGVITQALTPLTDAGGGYTVPTDTVSEIEKKANEPIVVWPLVTVKKTRSNSVTKPTVTTYVTPNVGTSANAESATTATAITETSPVFSELTWTLYVKDAYIPIKLTLLDESAVDIYQEVIDLAADGFSVKREYDILHGRGDSYKESAGILRNGSISTVAISAAPSVANIVDLVGNLSKRYRARAQAVMDGQTLAAVVSALAQNVRAAQYLLDYLPPMHDSEQMYEGKILVGDFSRFVVYQSADMKIVSSVAAQRLTQDVVLYDKWVGQVTITDAFVIGTGVTY